jgi:Tol biopolymer transport system component
MLSRWSFLLLLVFLSVFCCSVTGMAASPVMINDPLPANSTVYHATFTPDGNHVLYIADQDAFGTAELFIAPADGGTPVQINDNFVAGGSISPSEIILTPNGTHTFYVADQEVDNRRELFVAPITGGSSMKLSGPLAANGLVDSSTVNLSPDGSRIVYAANQESPSQFDLYSVDIAGGTPTRLSSPSGSSDNFYHTVFSPDSSQVLIVHDLDIANSPELYIVPVTGGTPMKLNTPVSSGDGVENSSAQFTADGNHVVYIADTDGSGRRELFVVPNIGGTPVMLNAPLVAGGRVDEYVNSPDGSEIVYLADQDTDGVDELYITSVYGGSTPLKLNGALAAGGDVDDDGFRFSPDGNFVVFTAEVSDATTNELFIVPRTGGTPLKLNGPLAAGGDVNDSSRATLFSHDGSRVVYAAEQNVVDVTELFSVPSTGGAATKLNGPLVPGGEVHSGSVRHHAEDNRLIYTADDQVDEVNELYIVPLEGGKSIRLSEAVAEGYSVHSAEFSPDGDRVLFMAWNSSFQTNAYTSVIRQRFISPAGYWDDDDVWQHDEVPDAGMHIIVDSSSVVTVPGIDEAGDEPEFAYKVDLGGGASNSTLKLEEGAAVSIDKGLFIHSKGVLRGDGQINADVDVAAGGDVRVAAGQQLHFLGSSFSNAGRIEAIGTVFDHAEIEFDNAVVNAAGTGLITGTHARLRFDGGLNNVGSLALSVGESHVFGDITNTGSIVVTGGANVTFYDDIVQNGVLTISKVGDVSSAAVFLGDVSGSGTMGGGGDVFVEGDLSPGNSPGTITFNNNIFLGHDTTVEIEIGGHDAGSTHDTIQVNGELALNGVLDATLIGAFLPDGGSAFEIINASGGISGAFNDAQLPAPRGGITWELVNDSQTVRLIASGVRGDYNFDGIVDAADYIVWRKMVDSHDAAADGNGDGIIDSGDRLVWSSHFGHAGGAGSARAAPAAAPEPSLVAMLTAAGLALTAGSRRRVRCRPSARHFKPADGWPPSA